LDLGGTEGRKGQTPTSHLEINYIHGGEAEWTTPEFIQGPDRSYACVIIDFVIGEVAVVVELLCLAFGCWIYFLTVALHLTF
jgi:hypothetical protein